MSSFSPSADAFTGSLRANLPSVYSNNNNGLVLGLLELNQVANNNSNYFLSVDTKQSNSPPVISIPRGQSNLTISMVDLSDNVISTNAPDWHIVLEFRVIDDLNFSNTGAFN